MDVDAIQDLLDANDVGTQAAEVEAAEVEAAVLALQQSEEEEAQGM